MSRRAGQRRRDRRVLREMAAERGPVPRRWRGWVEAWAAREGITFADMWLFLRYG